MQREWISVKDKLPNNDIETAVLVTDGTNMFVALEWYPEKDDWSYSYCCGCRAYGITHWMRLPSVPCHENTQQE